MGLNYMYRAGYDPTQVSIFLTKLSRMSGGPVGYSVYCSTILILLTASTPPQ
jgi:predicted Zn-dependent protease